MPVAITMLAHTSHRDKNYLVKSGGVRRVAGTGSGCQLQAVITGSGEQVHAGAAEADATMTMAARMRRNIIGPIPSSGTVLRTSRLLANTASWLGVAAG